jgi:phosphatidate cytidylyltransferase
MKRVFTALILIPLITYLVVFAPQWLFLLAVAAVASLCFYEYSGLVALHNIAPPGVFGYAAGLSLILLPQHDAAFLIVIAVLAMALSLRSFELADGLPSAGALLLGIVYTFGALRCTVDLHLINPYWALFALSLNWVGDTAAFYVGRTIGRHKLAPRISPGKSWEGAIASVIFSMLYAAVYFSKLMPAVPLLEAILIAGAGNIAGQIGDLTESAFKRGAGVKDSGNLLPGHGGWLDRLDSSLFALPVVYFLISNLRPALLR